MKWGNALALLVAGILFASGASALVERDGFRSVELGIATASPKGYFGGTVVPASCPSYAHAPGECTSGGGGGGGTGTSGTADQCTNIAGLQETVPSGYAATGSTCNAISCENNPYNVSCDRCSNIAGVQQTMPQGHRLYQGQCLTAETCSLTGGESEIADGGATLLEWNCKQSVSASGVGFSTGGQPSGTAQVSPTQNTTYTLQCDAGCSATFQVKIKEPTLSISANPTRVRSGNSSTLYWGATMATECAVTGPNFSASGVAGSRSTGPITSQTIYTLTCQTSKGIRSASVTVGLIPSQIEI